MGLYEVALNESPVTLTLGSWVESNGIISISWEFQFDTLTLGMLFAVMVVSSCVQCYSLGYQDGDPHINRFFSLLSLFTFAMVLLVTGDNLFVMFQGWELVGLVSYLLVNYWYTSISNNFSAMKAQFLNKIGDWAVILAIVISMGVFGDVSFPVLFSQAHKINTDLLLLALLVLIIASSTKSAQVGLNVWLSAAMAAPTPVSALLHSSTMVTAGIYLLIRISPMLEQCTDALLIIVLQGALTALLGASCGLVENDIKKIIAFSTASQLGYMMVACGVSQYSLALAHLINHAFFKSLLFLTAGSFIHALQDQQDVRRMGGLALLTPTSYSLFLIGSLALQAFPFFSGFYSKDLLLEILLVPINVTHTIAYILTLLAAQLTTVYSLRVMMMAMWSRPQFPIAALHFVQEPSRLMTAPMMLLSVGAVALGYLTQDSVLDFGSTLYGNSIFTHPDNVRQLDAAYANSNFALIPLIFLILVIAIIPLQNRPGTAPTNPHIDWKHINTRPTQTIHTWRYSNIFDPYVMNHFNNVNHWIMQYTMVTSNFIYRYVDRGSLEIFGATGQSRTTAYLAFIIEIVATGFIMHQAIIIQLFITIIMFVPLYGLPFIIQCTLIILSSVATATDGD